MTVVLIHHFFSQDKLLPREKLPTKEEGTAIPQWNHILLLHYISSLDRKCNVSPDLSHISNRYSQSNPPKAPTPLNIYIPFYSQTSLPIPVWHTQHGKKTSTHPWHWKTGTKSTSISTRVSTQENVYTNPLVPHPHPTLIHKLNPDIPDIW